MSAAALHPQARLTLALMALYTTAEALCGVFLSVFLLSSAQDMGPVLIHYIALYASAPVFFLVAGRIARSRDRTWVYRIGLGLLAAYYGALLALGTRAPDYAGALGLFYGFCTAFFWAGANTMTFEVTRDGVRERYLGILSAVNGTAQMIAPLAGAALIALAPEKGIGYQWVFACAAAIYLACFFLSFRLTPDGSRGTFRIMPVLFPGAERRDWRLVLLATITDGGGHIMFALVLGLLVFVETGSEVSVGGYASVQALAYVATSALAARWVTKARRRAALTFGVVLLIGSGLLLLPEITLGALIAFGILRSIAEPIYGIAQTGLRFDVIAKSMEDSSQRIEYVCAWEAPLGVGRVIVLSALLAAYWGMDGNPAVLRVILFGLCCSRFVSYLLLLRTDEIRTGPPGTP